VRTARLRARWLVDREWGESAPEPINYLPCSMSAFAFAVTAFEPPRWPRETACQILSAAPRSIDPSRSAFDGSYEGWVASVTGATGVGSTVSDDCSTNSTVTHPHRSISDSSGATSTGRVTDDP